MKIKKGTRVLVKHARKGNFKAIAQRDFDTTKEEFYPFLVADDYVEGLNTDWEKGESIPCRHSLCSIEIIK